MKKLLYLLILISLIACTSNCSSTHKMSEAYSDTTYIPPPPPPPPPPPDPIEVEILEDDIQEFEEIREIISLPDAMARRESREPAGEIQPAIIYEDAGYGDINYIMEDTMIVNKSTIINMTISESIDREEIIEEIESFTEENTITNVIRIAPVMRAKLVDPSGGENFTIVPITSEEQLIENDEFTKWEWDVTPLKEGNNKLKLTVDIIIEDRTKNIEVYEDFIYVYSDKTWWDNFVDFMGENWQWFLSTLIIPLLIWFYKIKKRKT
ncbi:MAG: hypothetical protein RQ856_05120 [Candidatus Izemoplasmatales bacterium]|nr:hypothetical protein [Candidatus Izemoplasmatales bacterium]